MENKEFSKELEEPPSTDEPPGKPRHKHPWEGIPPALWNDWRWQLSHRLNTVE